MAILQWVASLGFHHILSALLHHRLHEAHQAKCDDLVRSFLEALGRTTREVVIELVRELPVAEVLADALCDGATALTLAETRGGVEERRGIDAALAQSQSVTVVRSTAVTARHAHARCP